MQIHTHSVIIIGHETKFTLVTSHLRVLFHVSFAFLHFSWDWRCDQFQHFHYTGATVPHVMARWVVGLRDGFSQSSGHIQYHRHQQRQTPGFHIWPRPSPPETETEMVLLTLPFCVSSGECLPARTNTRQPRVKTSRRIILFHNVHHWYFLVATQNRKQYLMGLCADTLLSTSIKHVLLFSYYFFYFQ